MSHCKRFDLPDECWELVFRSLNDGRHYDSLSSVCKRFLSITNGLRSCLSILHCSIPSIPRLLLRFPAINSIDLSHFCGDTNSVLRLISRSGLSLDSLDLSNRKELLVDGLRELGSTMRNLRVLKYSKAFIHDDVLIVIANCFPSLQELNINFPRHKFSRPVSDKAITTLATTLKDLRKVNLAGNRFITDVSLLSLCENCEFLREIKIKRCDSMTLGGICSAICRRPTLTSICLSIIKFGMNDEVLNINLDFVNSLTSLKCLTAISLADCSVPDEVLCSIAEQGFPLKKLCLNCCDKYTYPGIFCLLSKCQSIQHLELETNDFLTDNDVVNLSGFLRNLTFINLNCSQKLTQSTFFTLARCPLLNEIKMQGTTMGLNAWRDKVGPKDLVNSQIKTLHLCLNHRLKDKNLNSFDSICPNLEYLDLKYCKYISDRGVAQVLKKCSKIRHLNLAFCSKLCLIVEINFPFLLPNLEVLNLSFTSIDDQSLSLISNTCCGLIHLDLENCSKVTAKGVKQVVQKYTRLRKINLCECTNVKANIVNWMVSKRPSLRRIKAPPGYVHKKLFPPHGCVVLRRRDTS